MNVTAAVVDRLIHMSAVTDVVGDRVARDQPLSSWAEQLPYIVVHSHNSNFEYHGSGIVCPIEGRLDLEIYDTNGASADLLFVALLDTEGDFNGNSWSASGVTVERLLIDSESVQMASAVAGEQYGDHRRLIPCTVWWRPAT